VAAYRLAREEFTRERVPLDWAVTQNNLGNALSTLGSREAETARLTEAVAAFDACLTVVVSAWPDEWVRDVCRHCDDAQVESRAEGSNSFCAKIKIFAQFVET
jgi:hypothetical protein